MYKAGIIQLIMDSADKLYVENITNAEKMEIINDTYDEIIEILRNDSNNKMRISNVFDFGLKKQKDNTLSEYNIIVVEFKNKAYYKQKYGVDECHKFAVDIYKKLHNFLSDDEIIGNHFPGAYMAFVKNENVENFIANSLSHKLILSNGEEIDLDTKVVYRPISINEKVIDVLDDTIICMEKIIENDDIDLMKLDNEKSHEYLKNEKILGYFNTAICNKEFLTYYQPKVNSQTGELCGAEALVRWQHGDIMISPSVFIPLIDNTSKMCILDYYMLESVCRDIKGWLEDGIEPQKISVNFSRSNFKTAGFVQNILNIINTYEIPSKYIEVELTESIKNVEKDVVKSFIDTLHKNGIEVSMDDFGTGYSSLASLISLDFDTIKIDKCLIDNIDNRKAYTILSVIKDFCNKFGINTIVEGVETLKNVKVLKELGYDVIQGYYFDKPLPKEEFEQRLVQNTYSRKL